MRGLATVGWGRIRRLLPGPQRIAMASKTALITGITGQDGSYLAEFLLQHGYHVAGIVRRSSTENFQRIEHLREQVNLYQADLLDQTSLARVLEQVKPHEVYN